jgi:WhiB family redox-sensing transcriptional regulator
VIPPEYLALMLTILAGVPRLENPACAGRPDLFDSHAARDPGRQHDQAQALRWCARCESLGPCRAWLAAMPAWNRPAGGVMAGVVLEAPRTTPPTGRKPGPKIR